MLSISEITAREQLYQFFASLFLKEPSREWLEGLIVITPYLKELFADEISFQEWDQLIDHYLKGSLKIEEIQQDFYDLFFVPTSGRYLPAVESIVLYNKLWGETEVELAKRYEQTKFIPEQLDIFPSIRQLRMSDHLGYELGYMAYLCNMETHSRMEIRQQIQGEEIEMLEDHLIPFVKRYAETFIPIASGTFYGLFVQLLEKFLETDRQMILTSEVNCYGE
ncbi:TorD/DmsD family molecular chaperone [Tepidibacillus fermentans]|uniref:TorA maturation chaperone TorD n=1 Tax=Tepidibacillus fermentans TaxID=1281767 RepID=A0A4R3KGB4_9BACI|nr:molecular chaperone TorD family protein [Tepidibacillus fermentans]TCS82454.1 TorA maturation chaperone TorD [Tepidibacillus fermentans]